MKLDHPTIRNVKAQLPEPEPAPISLKELRQLCLDCGADDAGVVLLDRPELDTERPYVLQALPSTQAVISIVIRMSPEAVRSTKRSLANQEFHSATQEVNHVARSISKALRERGIRSLPTAAGFPMEMTELPGRSWIVAHKVVAEAAGMGKMGIHRNVIHPIFGNFILLDSILIDTAPTEDSQPIDYNPCLECKLCVAACPVGAIAPDGHFDSVACLNHNYREFFGGFIDWVDTVADSKNRREYQGKFEDTETASLWQSLSFGANYKSAYCVAACPAGEDVIGPFLRNKAKFIKDVLNPLQEKEEPIYVVPGSDADAYVQKRFPHKRVRHIGSGLRPRSLAKLLEIMPLGFQRGKARGLKLRIHFTFTGTEPAQMTFTIENQKLEIEHAHAGTPDLAVTADSRAWVDFVAKRRSLPNLLLTRSLRLRGNPKHLIAFGKCFPG
jgi:NAD-dependent dihydropyrimidine dehydrogenase PreA subunit